MSWNPFWNASSEELIREFRTSDDLAVRELAHRLAVTIDELEDEFADFEELEKTPCGKCEKHEDEMERLEDDHEDRIARLDELLAHEYERVNELYAENQQLAAEIKRLKSEATARN